MPNAVENFYSSYIHKSRYARYLDSEKRRETWEETVQRYIKFWINRFPQMEGYLWQTAYPAIINKEVMPSMRALMTAGPALERDEISGYNCSFIAVDNVRAFDECLYILSCGTGVGFSVERQFINQLPTISESFSDSGTVLKVRDSRIGWASAFRELISLLYW
jgi:ribonucleoside-diphosphate reductase alpha chain